MDYIERPEQEEKYQELAQLGAKLGLAVPEVFVELKITRDFGKGEVARHIKRRSHSWTRAAWNAITIDGLVVNPTGSTYEDGSLAIRDVDGTYDTSYQYMTMFGLISGSSPNPSSMEEYTWDWINSHGLLSSQGEANTRGINFGIGTNAESFDDYKLQTVITNGVGTNQLAYQTMPYPTKNWVSATRTWEMSHERIANNNSGADINLTEIGLYYGYGRGWYYGYRGCMIRDVFSPAEVIYDKAQIKVTYTWKLVYPLARQSKTGTAKANISS